MLHCWCVGTDGTAQLTIYYGSRVLELVKDLDAVRLVTTDDLVGLLEQIKTAAEEDEMIALQLATRKCVNNYYFIWSISGNVK